jgi:hypothetical protein
MIQSIVMRENVLTNDGGSGEYQIVSYLYVCVCMMCGQGEPWIELLIYNTV